MSDPLTSLWRWDIFYGITAVGVAVLAATNSGSFVARAAAVASIAVIAALYAVWGRRLIETEAHPQGILFAGTVVLIFGAGVYAVGAVSYLLFGLGPLIFMVLPLRRSIPTVLVASAVPVIAAVLRYGFDREMLTELVPIFVVSGAISVVLGTFITRVVEQSQERGRLITELHESRAEVARLSREAGVAAERERLAGEIHDTLAQGFTSIITLLQAADPQLADERLALAVRTARENLAEARTLIAALTPPALTDGSLADAVRRLTTGFTAETGIPATCRVIGDPRSLPTPTEVVLLRAAKEALANVRRHARAGEVSVLLAYGGADARLVVRDNGDGFVPDAAGGFGLSGMRSRVEQVSGHLEVRSAPGKGTTVEVEVPA